MTNQRRTVSPADP